jgi:hypothetical protein
LKVNVSITGSFSAESATAGTETAQASCEGTGCATLAANVGTTFPCTVTRPFTAVGP